MKANKSSRIRIGIKYCGGCKPNYDRVASVESLEKSLSDKIQLVSYQEPDVDTIFVVTGCDTACVNMDQFKEKSYRLLSNENDFKTTIDEFSKN
ncbi:hypothetical protein KKA14_02400 [bacterium]|nr:hypothetical protein [bacterium]